MQNYDDSNKEFRSLFRSTPSRLSDTAVRKDKKINQLLDAAGSGIGALRARLLARDRVLGEVRALLPAELAAQVLTAGLERGELSIGVRGAGWASRLRFGVEDLRSRLAATLGEPITRVRIRVLPTAA